ncbi:MAG TPA: sugar phosphate isomerase/epimerase family protein [Vicinamibacteria bacterium]|nr:sugar phosphate isomerase/epimerase family protein [Vicinamibacteria bacterium]
MPKLAAFPKAWMQGLCRDGSLSLERWIEMAGELEIDGLEFYSGFLDLREKAAWPRYRRLVEQRGLGVPMLCCSPDFTHPSPAYRRDQVEKEKGWIEMAAALGCSTCRVLSGQRRPGLTREQGLRFAAESIEACLPHAEAAGIILVIENHYKDDFWEYPEFAQKMDVFCDLVARVASPHFGVNYDPSNTLLAGEDPLELLRRVRHRVVTMHASDRYLAVGTLEDLRREETSVGYAKRLRHGEIGKGLNDYDAIFGELRGAGFDGWISIEDGVLGMDQMRRSVAFLRGKMRRYWPEG